MTVVANPDPVAAPGSPDPAAAAPAQPAAQPAAAAPQDFSWKTQLPTDLQNAPSLKAYPDTKEGFANAIKSHLSLEKLLGHEKAPIPKGKDDAEGRAAFNRAMGVPESADGYKLADANIPDSLKGFMIDKAKFAQIMHGRHATPDQAAELWKEYTDNMVGVYSQAEKAQRDKVTSGINMLRQEWGDAFQSNVDLGQKVLNLFAGDKEGNDHLTALLVGDPVGMKFLASIGKQFSENKIGDFKYQNYAMSPDDAQAEIEKIRQNPNHPYVNDKASPAERDRAIEYVNSLISIVNKGKR